MARFLFKTHGGYVSETIADHPSDSEKKRISQVFDIPKTEVDDMEKSLKDQKIAVNAEVKNDKVSNINNQLDKFPK